MKERIYYWLRTSFRQETRNNIKEIFSDYRKKCSWLLQIRHGSFTADELRNELYSKIGDKFNILMVHSSYNDLLPMYSQSAFELLKMLKSFCGKDITLVMASFCFGGKDYNIQNYYKEGKMFDVKRTPSQMGLLTEIFRRQPGVRRSLHPTHSICALGPLAKQLTTGHHLAATTFGKGTPFTLMASENTGILGIGVKYYTCLTQVHTVEDLLGNKYPVKLVYDALPVALLNEHEEKINYTLPVLDSNISRNRRIDILRKLLSSDELIEWKYKGVPMFFTMARKVTESLINAAAKGRTIYPKLGDRQ